jgi:hypothetical protein
MTAIVVKTFDGLKPIASPRLIGVESAQVAKNVRLISGTAAPLRGVSTLKATVTASPKTIYRYGNSSTETDYWLEFANDTDVMRSSVAADQWDRLYWTDGDNRPRYAPNNLILSGTHYPGASYELGIPKPTAEAVVTSFSAPITYERVSRSYVMTHLSSTGKESTAGPVFTVLSVNGEKVNLSGIAVTNRGDSSITKKRIYRKVEGTYRRIAELNMDITAFEDAATDASLSSAPALATAIGSAPQSPSRAPSVSAPSTANFDTAKSRSYVYTVKNILAGEDYYGESAPSAVRTITADNTQSVTLSGFTSSAGSATGNGGYKIYRKDPDSSSYLLIADIPASQTSFVDVISKTTLGAPVNSDAPNAYSPAQPTASTGSSTQNAPVRRVYMVTFVDNAGVESSRSPNSDAVTVIDGVTTVSLSHSESVPAGVSRKRIYRQTLTGTGMNVDDSAWRLVSEGAASSTSAVDNQPNSALTVSYPTALQGLPPAPADTPLSNATIPSDQVPESRTYVYTYVSQYGEEGPPSDASELVKLNPDESCTVSVPGSPTGDYNITIKRIYRSSAAGNAPKFQLVADIPVGQTSYVDAVKQAGLGEILPSELWIAPPAGLKGLRMMANGAAVGFKGRTLYLSEPNLPHAWPHEYTIDDEIVGIGVFGQSVAVMTKSFPYLFQGVDPAAMSQNKLKLPQSCVGKRSIIETGDGVVYASPDGLVSIGASVGVITQSFYSRDQWQAFLPTSMECYTHNGRVLVSYNTGTVRGMLVIDVSGQGATLTTTDINQSAAITAGYYEPKTDVLYFSQGGNIVRYDQGSSLGMVWRSKIFRLFAPENFSIAQLRAAAYPVTFKLYADGNLKLTKTVSDGSPFRLPAGFRGLDWEFQFESTNEVNEVTIASSVEELRQS